MARLLKEIAVPHRHLHESARKIDQLCKDDNKTAAYQVFKSETSNALSNTQKLLAGLKEHFKAQAIQAETEMHSNVSSSISVMVYIKSIYKLIRKMN